MQLLRHCSSSHLLIFVRILLLSCASTQVFADCRRDDINAHWVYSLEVAGQLHALGSAQKVALSDTALCIVDRDDTPQSELLKHDQQLWLLEYSLPESWFALQQPLPLSVKRLSAWPEAAANYAVNCAQNLVLQLNQPFQPAADSCLAPLSGLTLSAQLFMLDALQQQAVKKEKKNFWDFEKANEAALKRMKKF